MLKNAIRNSVLTALALALPTIAVAQAPAPGQMPPEAQQMIMEMQEIQSELQAIQQEAMQDPEIRATGEALGNEIQVAMQETDPATSERIERLETLSAEAHQAQVDQDRARMAEIVGEAEQLNQQLGATQAEALQRADIAPRVAEFEARIEARMSEINPEFEQLIARLDELNAELSAMLGQG